MRAIARVGGHLIPIARSIAASLHRVQILEHTFPHFTGSLLQRRLAAV